MSHIQAWLPLMRLRQKDPTAETRFIAGGGGAGGFLEEMGARRRRGGKMFGIFSPMEYDGSGGGCGIFWDSLYFNLLEEEDDWFAIFLYDGCSQYECLLFLGFIWGIALRWPEAGKGLLLEAPLLVFLAGMISRPFITNVPDSASQECGREPHCDVGSLGSGNGGLAGAGT